jgi:hypothetical protein
VTTVRYILVGVIAGIAAVFAWTTFANQRRVVAEIEGLRARLFAARAAADSCRTALAVEQQDFLAFDAEVDSLRGEVRSYEDPDAGGVPQAQYDEYLERFEGYNDSVAAWQDRADQLRATEARCRELVDTHNAIGDSLRVRLGALEQNQ